MSGVQEGQERPLNLLITLSPNSHGSLRHGAVPLQPVAPAEVNLLIHVEVAPSGHWCRMTCRPWITGSSRCALQACGEPPTTIGELIPTLEE